MVLESWKWHGFQILQGHDQEWSGVELSAPKQINNLWNYKRLKIAIITWTYCKFTMKNGIVQFSFGFQNSWAVHYLAVKDWFLEKKNKSF